MRILILKISKYTSQLNHQLKAYLNAQKPAVHSDIKTNQKYYLAVEKNYLEKARGAQSEILRNELTDPKTTHFGKNGKSFKESKKI